MYMCDTETTHENNKARVWLVDSCYIGEPYEHLQHKNIGEWVTWAIETGDTYYFHNLKYDGSYIVDWLLKHNYQYSSAKELNNGEFFALVTELNQWFKIIIRNNDKIISIYDSYKKIPLGVKNIAKSYKLPMSKGEIDYNAYRPEGYEANADEIDYIKRDTEIVARVLKLGFDQGRDKISAPADALEEFKKTCKFEQTFCTHFYSEHPEIDTFCRRAYCGGISWVNPIVKGLDMMHGYVYDYNSMYPSVMLMYPMPLYVPVKFLGTPKEGWLYIARCKVDITRQGDKPACIRSPKRKEWIEDSYEGELYLTSIDIELLEMCYFGTYEIIDGYQWQGHKGVFDKYITHWRKVKEESEGGIRQTAKLNLNSLYGKFGTNPMKAKKKPVLVDNIVKWVTMEPEYTKCVNVAVAAYITAYARRELVQGILNTEGIFCYCDTDSIHVASGVMIEGKLTGQKCAKFKGKVDQKSFGAWKRESQFVRGKYLRQKTYIEEMSNGKLTIAACGCPDESRKYITYDNFKIGASFKGKLMQKTVDGGCILIEKRFTIREPITSF